MPIQLKVKVTKEIIMAPTTVSRMANACGIYWALKPLFENCWVSPIFILVQIKEPFGDTTVDRDVRIYLPDNAKRFIHKFDRIPIWARRFLKPIEFEITVPDQVINAVNIEEVKSLLVGNPYLELVN